MEEGAGLLGHQTLVDLVELNLKEGHESRATEQAMNIMERRAA
jgi:hypothetical protein